MVKFQRVTETDEDGEDRLVTLEVTANEIFRTSKAQMWEARIPFAAIVNIEMRRSGSSDRVIAETKHGNVSWMLKEGQSLRDAIDAGRFK
jgi:hypothetical protein|tara:strand:- start:6087 stop:6356 length:270 start_codon:yes stop_codon:yes gene_type:complete